MTGRDLKSKRINAGIAGHLLCKKTGIARSRLSYLEHDYITPSTEELARLSVALDELIQAKGAINRAAVAAGWPIAEVA